MAPDSSPVVWGDDLNCPLQGLEGSCMRVYEKTKVCDLLSGPIHRFKDAKSALWLASLAACLKVSTEGQIQSAPLSKNVD